MAIDAAICSFNEKPVALYALIENLEKFGNLSMGESNRLAPLFSNERQLNEYKYKRLFKYEALSSSEANRGTVGIPRVLNLYESYPFWFTLFTELGLRVELFDRSSSKLFQQGIETIPLESVCYPGELIHGNIMNLIEKGEELQVFNIEESEIKESVIKAYKEQVAFKQSGKQNKAYDSCSF